MDASEEVNAGADAKKDEAGEMAFSEEQMTVIQSAIEELLAKQIGANRAPGEGAKNQEEREAPPEHVPGNEESSDFHSADEDNESDEDKHDDDDDDGFLVGFPTKLVK